MPELEKIETPVEVIKPQVNDKIVEKENTISKPELVEKEDKFSDIHIPFIIAFVDCDYQKVNSFLSKDPSLVNFKNPFDGNTALHFACKFEDIALIKCLVGNYKADVNIINHSGKTPLHYCAEFDKDEAAKLLISQYGAKKDIRDYNGKLPVDWLKPNRLEVMEKTYGKPSYTNVVKEEKAPHSKMNSIVSLSFSRLR